MNELRNDDRIAYAAVDEALWTYPLAPAPAQLLPAVMARLQALDPMPRFRLHWLDYAVSLFVAGMAGLILLLRWSIPPQALLRTQVQLWLLQQYISSAYLWLTFLAGLTLLAIMIFGAAILFSRSRTSFQG